MDLMNMMRVESIMILDDVYRTDRMWYVSCCDGVIMSLFERSPICNKNNMICLNFMNRRTFMHSHKFACIWLSVESGQRISLLLETSLSSTTTIKLNWSRLTSKGDSVAQLDSALDSTLIMFIRSIWICSHCKILPCLSFQYTYTFLRLQLLLMMIPSAFFYELQSILRPFHVTIAWSDTSWRIWILLHTSANFVQNASSITAPRYVTNRVSIIVKLKWLLHAARWRREQDDRVHGEQRQRQQNQKPSIRESEDSKYGQPNP